MVPVTDLPRERLQCCDPSVLSDAELLAVILGTASVATASQLLSRFGDLRRLAVAGVRELSAVTGVGEARACRLKAALALAGRLAAQPYVRGEPIERPLHVYERVGRRLAFLEHEVFVGLAVDTKHRVLTELRLAQGGACSVDIIPRDVFRAIVREAAYGVIFLHNHPSGDPSPSQADRALTERLRLAGDLVGVHVLDHVIAAHDGFRAYSLGWKDERP
jgi:DNA repair protein RadC